MGKRSAFQRRPMDDYDTPAGALPSLIPHLKAEGVERFAEPCCGNGALVQHLERAGFRCVYMDDLKFGGDALNTAPHIFDYADCVVTNPPWSRPILHALIDRLMRIKPTWLLFDSDWIHTRQAAPYWHHCSTIVSVGRLRWIEGSPFTGKDNCAWHRFDFAHQEGPRMFGRIAA